MKNAKKRPPFTFAYVMYAWANEFGNFIQASAFKPKPKSQRVFFSVKVRYAGELSATLCSLNVYIIIMDLIEFVVIGIDNSRIVIVSLFPFVNRSPASI